MLVEQFNVCVFSLDGVFELTFGVPGATYVNEIFVTKDGYLLTASNAGISIFNASNGSVIVNYPHHSFAPKAPFAALSMAVIEQRGNFRKLLVAQTAPRPLLCLLLYTRPAVAWLYSPLQSVSFSDIEIVVQELLQNNCGNRTICPVDKELTMSLVGEVTDQ